VIQNSTEEDRPLWDMCGVLHVEGNNQCVQRRACLTISASVELSFLLQHCTVRRRLLLGAQQLAEYNKTLFKTYAHHRQTKRRRTLTNPHYTDRIGLYRLCRKQNNFVNKILFGQQFLLLTNSDTGRSRSCTIQNQSMRHC